MALLDDLARLLGAAGTAGRRPGTALHPKWSSEGSPEAVPDGIRQEMAELRRRVEALERWLQAMVHPQERTAPGRARSKRAAAAAAAGPAATARPSSSDSASYDEAVDAPAEALARRQGPTGSAAGQEEELALSDGLGAPAENEETVLRLPRQVTRQKALNAARRLRRLGKPITLASVARSAGLKYSQVVYAFGRRESLLTELEED